MGFIDNIKKIFSSEIERKAPDDNVTLSDVFSFNSMSVYRPTKAMKLSAVYRCVDLISDSIAQLPIEPFIIDEQGYKHKATVHPLYYVLNKRPNKKMTRFTFMKTMVTNMLLKGNAYALIKRDQIGNAKELVLLDPDIVVVMNDEKSETVHYEVAGIGRVEDEDMIHILNFTYDGIVGVSTIQHAFNTLQLAADSEAHSEGFFRGGSNLAGYLKIDGPLTPKQKEDNKKAWMNSFSASGGQPNSIAVLEGNMSYHPVQISPQDAQLLESRQFNVIEICRFFGVSPVKCFDLSKSSYSTIEATQLAFMTDTIQPQLEKYELEFEVKLPRPSERKLMDIRFDTSSLLRTDKVSLANYWSRLFNMGAIDPNYIKKELDLPPVDGGDNSFLQMNLAPIKNIIEKEDDNKVGEDR